MDKSERRANRLVVAATVLAIPLLLVAAALAVRGGLVGALFGNGDASIDCDEYVFDPHAWHTAGEQQRERQAEGLHECGALIGDSRRSVIAELGREGIGNRRNLLSYDVGEVNDYMGPGDARHLNMRLSHGRVTEVRLNDGID